MCTHQLTVPADTITVFLNNQITQNPTVKVSLTKQLTFFPCLESFVKNPPFMRFAQRRGRVLNTPVSGDRLS
jgi:hypothetical protein